jgi:phytoene synthase
VARNTTFYYAFLVLPRERRDAIITLWDFCRAADDSVDLSADDRAASEALAHWRTELAACYGEGAPATELGRRLQGVIARFQLPRQPFEDLLDGIAMDLTQKRYASFNDLYRYCLRVASAVGLLSVEIFGYRSAAARDYAVELGIALQLTNILRDIGADLSRDRIYVPREDLERYGVAEDDLREAARGPMPPHVRRLLAGFGDRARLYFERAAQALPKEDTRRLVSAEIMGAVYFALLRRIERADYEVFARRMSVPRVQRVLIALRVWLVAQVRNLWA